MATKPKIPQFQLERKFTSGYLDKIPVFEMPEGAAQAGSYNFIVGEDGKWATRWGTKYFGTPSTDTGGCRNASVLIRRDGIEIPTVQYGTKVKYFHPQTLDWAILLTGLSPTATMGFATDDLQTETANVLIMTDGVDPYQIWNGATSTIVSTTTSTILLNSTNPLSEIGFNPIGTVVYQDGTQYAYQGINKTALANYAISQAGVASLFIQGNLSVSALGFTASGGFTDGETPYLYTSISGESFIGVTPDPTQNNSPTIASFTSNSITIGGTTSLFALNYQPAGSIYVNGVIFTYALPTVASVSSNSITINGSTSLSAYGFWANGHIYIDGTEFTYTGTSAETFSGVTPDPTAIVSMNDPVYGFNTDHASLTFPNVSPDPTLNGIAVGQSLAATAIVYGDTITQTGVTPTLLGVTPDPSALIVGGGVANLPTIPSPSSVVKGSVIATGQDARVIMGNVTQLGTIYGNGSVYISAIDSYTNFIVPVTRVTGDPATLNAPNGGGTCTGIQPYENNFVFAKDRVIYNLTMETATTPYSLGVLVTSEGSISPLCFFPSENTIKYVTADFTISSLQRVATYDQFSQILPISDPIKKTMDLLYFDKTTAGHYYDGVDLYSMKSAKTTPLNNTILAYDNRYGCWDTPYQGLNAACFFIYGSDRYMCDANTPNVYLMGSESQKLYRDFISKISPGFVIPSQLVVRTNNFGVPAIKKEFTEYWVEGEMFLTDSVTYTADYDNASHVISGTIKGTQQGISYPAKTGGFGVATFGFDTFGGGSTGSEASNEPVRFRMTLTADVWDFYELTLTIKPSGYFKLISHGPKLVPSTEVADDAIYQAF